MEVEGFLFRRLLERKPEKQQELLTLRDHLLASSSASDTLKVFPDLPNLHLCPNHSSSHSSSAISMRQQSLGCRIS